MRAASHRGELVVRRWTVRCIVSRGCAWTGLASSWAALFLVGAGLALGACDKHSADEERVSPRAAPVEVQLVTRRDLPIEVTAIGTVEATNTVSVLPQVGGRITRVAFVEGAFVESGDVLFTLDTRPYNASLAAAEAELNRSRAAVAQAAAETQRYDALAREGLASEQERQQRKAELDAAEASMQAARAAIASANLNVQFATIRAPIDGRTGALLVTVGNVVQAGGTNPLVVIRSLAPVKVSFNVPSPLLSKLRSDGGVLPLEVRATTRGPTPTTATGQLTFVDNSMDTQAGSLNLKATFANVDERLWPGDFVDVDLVLGTDEHVVVAPESAVAEGQQGAYAFVIDRDNVARLRQISIRRRTHEYVVVERGLEPGDRVVTNGALRLRDGTPVTVSVPEGPAPTTGSSNSLPTAGEAPSAVSSSSGSASQTSSQGATP